MNRLKQTNRIGKLAATTLFAFIIVSRVAQAGTQYASGSFTWDNGMTAAWASSSLGPYSSTWVSENDAIFEGSAGTVTLDASGVMAHNLTFNTTGYTIQNNTLTLSGTEPTISLESSSIATTISSVINGNEGLTKNGSGTLTLSGANVYSGGTTLRGGVLQANNNSALGTGTLTLDTSVLSLRLGNGVTMNNDITINGGLYATPGHAAIETITAGSTATLSNGTITVNATISPVLGNTPGSGLLICWDKIVSSLSLSVRRGPVVLCGGGSYPNMIFTEGTVKLGADNGIATNARLTIGGSGTSNNPTFDLAGYNQTLVGVLQGGVFLATVTNSSATASMLTNTGTNTSYSGTLCGTNLALTVNSGGQLTLSGTNTFGGGTTIGDGAVIVVNNSSALGVGSVTINPTANRLFINSGFTVENNIIINGGSPGPGRGLIENIGTGNANLSNGTITITATTANGGHFESTATGLLTINDPINASVPVSCRNGTVIFGGGGSYSLFNISQGTARLGADNGFSTSAILDLGNAVSESTLAVFDLAGYNQTVVGITRIEATSEALIGNGSTSDDSLLTVTGTSTFPGVIKDALGSGTRKVALTVNGGTLTLSGTNTYTGATTVLSGKLSLTHPQALSAGTDVTIAAGAQIHFAFTGTNTIGSLTVDGELLPPNRVYGTSQFPAAIEGATGYFRTTTGSQLKGTLVRLL